MGLRISPLLAIVYLDRIERRSLITGIIFYKRYIDDVFLVSSTANAMNTMLQNLNSCDPNIRFTVEHPDEDGFLPFLNTKVRINHGIKELEWYRKPMSKNILLHSRSAHPLYMKANVIRNLVTTKTRTCTRESVEVDRKIATILEENGYTTCQPRTWRPFFATAGIPLVLPYVNERLAKKVNHAIKSSRLPVKLIFRPPADLRSLLTSSRIYEDKCGRANCTYCTESKICQLKGTVYLVTCEGCGQRYVGETMRPLHKRMDEHVRALRNPASYPKSGFSRHRVLHHQREAPPALKVSVIHRTKEAPLERKLLEAIAIKRLSPEINNRDELMEAMRLIG